MIEPGVKREAYARQTSPPSPLATCRVTHTHTVTHLGVPHKQGSETCKAILPRLLCVVTDSNQQLG
jgi:hypothetical protein